MNGAASGKGEPKAAPRRKMSRQEKLLKWKQDRYKLNTNSGIETSKPEPRRRLSLSTVGTDRIARKFMKQLLPKGRTSSSASKENCATSLNAQRETVSSAMKKNKRISMSHLDFAMDDPTQQGKDTRRKSTSFHITQSESSRFADTTNGDIPYDSHSCKSKVTNNSENDMDDFMLGTINEEIPSFMDGDETKVEELVQVVDGNKSKTEEVSVLNDIVCNAQSPTSSLCDQSGEIGSSGHTTRAVALRPALEVTEMCVEGSKMGSDKPTIEIETLPVSQDTMQQMNNLGHIEEEAKCTQVDKSAVEPSITTPNTDSIETEETLVGAFDGTAQLLSATTPGLSSESLIGDTANQEPASSTPSDLQQLPASEDGPSTRVSIDLEQLPVSREATTPIAIHHLPAFEDAPSTRVSVDLEQQPASRVATSTPIDIHHLPVSEDAPSTRVSIDLEQLSLSEETPALPCPNTQSAAGTPTITASLASDRRASMAQEPSTPRPTHPDDANEHAVFNLNNQQAKVCRLSTSSTTSSRKSLASLKEDGDYTVEDLLEQLSDMESDITNRDLEITNLRYANEVLLQQVLEGDTKAVKELKEFKGIHRFQLRMNEKKMQQQQHMFGVQMQQLQKSLHAGLESSVHRIQQLETQLEAAKLENIELKAKLGHVNE